ncbi:hypothetical protein JCM10450v2_008247 [Rhodotorula kratochvilovae]
MTGTAEARPAPPRAQLDHLPTELKSQIARMCAAQDEAIVEWTAKFEVMHSDGSDELEYMRDMYGTSLGTLFCLSRGWAQIAAPFRFETLKASRIHHPTFRASLVAKWSRHMQKLDIDEASVVAYNDLIPVLGGLTHVKSIVVCQSFIEHILGSLHEVERSFANVARLHPLANLGAMNLLEVLSRATHLDVEYAASTHVRDIVLQARHGLKSLRLDAGLLRGGWETALCLVAHCPALANLELACRTFDHAIPGPETLPPLPPVERLSLEGPGAAHASLRIAALFERTLRLLRVDAPSDTWGAGYASPQQAPLARLEHLEIRSRRFRPFFGLLNPTTLPALRYITIGGTVLPLLDRPSESADLFSTLDAFDAPAPSGTASDAPQPRIVLFLYDDASTRSVSERLFAAQWNTSILAHRVRLDLGTSRNPAGFTLDHDEAHGRDRDRPKGERERALDRADLGRTLDFLQASLERAERAEREGTPAGEEPWLARVLQLAELERFARER